MSVTWENFKANKRPYRMRWFSLVYIKFRIRLLRNNIKYKIQRMKRGYSTYDLASGDIYLASLIADMLEWYADNSWGVPFEYAHESDPDYLDVEEMNRRRKEVYLRHIPVFRRYASYGYAITKYDDATEYDVLRNDMKQSIIWLADNFFDLWD